MAWSVLVVSHPPCVRAEFIPPHIEGDPDQPSSSSSERAQQTAPGGTRQDPQPSKHLLPNTSLYVMSQNTQQVRVQFTTRNFLGLLVRSLFPYSN